jgi:isoleucyl-tRNA synthetase
MNVRELVITSEESSYGVKYKLIPDSKTLGMKFKKDASKIRAALANVGADAIKEFVNTGKIDIAGFTLSNDELQVVRTFDSSNSDYHAHFTNEVLVILDTALDEGLLQEGLAREFINRVQRLRKKAGLQPIDDIAYYCTLTEDKDEKLSKMLVEQKDLLTKYLKQDILQSSFSKNKDFVIEEEQEINGSKFLLAFTKQ